MNKINIYLSSEGLREVLDKLGIKVISETSSEFLCFCPFHSNRDTPAFNISKHGPAHLWKCWNGRCGTKGNILTLFLKKGYTINEARKMLASGVIEIDELTEYILELLKADDPQDNEWHFINIGQFREEDKNNGFPGLRYAESRSVESRAYDFFRMGYSNTKKMFIIPIFDEVNRPVGVVGRSIQGKRYEYSKGFNRNLYVWNLNNARNTRSNYIVLTEGARDAVYVWQAGFESVGAVFGSSMSLHQRRLIRENFSEAICFFDNDEAGQGLTEDLINTFTDLTISVVKYPRDVKDPEFLTREEIGHMIETRRSAVEILLGI